MSVYRSNLSKPSYGSACSGCGYCCAVEPCEIAREFLGAGLAGVCPALERNEAGATACGMVVRPLHYLLADGLQRMGGSASDPAIGHVQAALSERVAQALGVGRGCDSDDDEHSAFWPWPVMLSG